MNKALNFLKNNQRLLSFIFLLLWLFSTWYLFFYLEIVKGLALQIAASISYLGFGFALFQFWFNHIISKERMVFELRYSTYKEIIKIIDTISETVNEELSAGQIIQAYDMLCKLTNQINKLASTLNECDQHLFINISKEKEAIRIMEIFDKIIRRTDKFRIAVESTMNKSTIEALNFIETIEAMNWHNDMRLYLNELHTEKYPFYAKFREYFPPISIRPN